MEKINRRLLKENARAVLKRNFWMPLLVCFIANCLGGNWNGLSSGLGGSGGGSSYNSSNTTIDYTQASGGDILMEDFLSDITNLINKTDKGSDFFYHYDSSISESDNLSAYYNAVLNYYNITSEEVMGAALMIIGVILLIIVFIWIIATVITFLLGSFVGAPIQVGYRTYFMKNREGIARFEDLFSSFTKGHYKPIVKSMFANNIRMWGWGLLFYFPGLVYSYKTYLVSYIMSENYNIAPERARELSTKMTDGHKWQIFVLELSFIGWIFLFVLVEILLAVISCGLLAIPGALLIFPIVAYQQATYAELYAERREYALHTGIATIDELPGFIPVTNGPVDMSGFYATGVQYVDAIPTDSSTENTDKNQ